jgi:hypothetical protein
VRIDATPEDIWPSIEDPSAWKTGPQLIAVSGQPGALGTRFNSVDPGAPDTILFHAENVEIIPQRRRTLRLTGVDGALIGFAIWELSRQDDSTVVEYHVYAQLPPDGDANSYRATNQQRFDRELATLKRLVESRR